MPDDALPDDGLPDDLAWVDATAQAELVRTGEASPLELVDAAIERIERVDPRLNAVIHRRFERARAEAAGELPDGPFRGVPIVLKDYDGMSEGDPFHAGNALLRRHGHVAPHDSELTARLRRAGFVIVGRANTPELGLVVTTEPQVYGPTRNPWDTDRSTGGSSGGSACAVASGMVPVAQAGDGGGSIRIPASECGLVGLKPARARHSLGPEAGESWGGLVVRGSLSRTVRDTAGVLDVVEGAAPGDPYVAPRPSRPFVEEVGADPGRLRVGVLTRAPDPMVHTHLDCVAAVDRAATLLDSLGHEVVEAYPEPLDDDETQARLTESFTSAFGVWVARLLDQLSSWTGQEVTSDDVEPATWAVAEVGRLVSGVQHQTALEYFHDYTRRVVSWWQTGYDLLLTPVLTEPPPPLGEFTATAEDPLRGLVRAAGLVPFTMPFNITGQPAVSLPLHRTAGGLPVGVQLVADQWREDVLLRIASQLEQTAPWADRIPPVHA